jgi:hypothetical protein
MESWFCIWKIWQIRRIGLIKSQTACSSMTLAEIQKNEK